MAPGSLTADGRHISCSPPIASSPPCILREVRKLRTTSRCLQQELCCLPSTPQALILI